MSRIGKRIVNIPTGVNVEIIENVVKVSGPKGNLEYTLTPNIKININGTELTVEREKETKEVRAMHGTTNALITNMIIGVSEGYKKELEITGVGYRFTGKGNILTINAGYSHQVNLDVPSNLKITVPSNTELVIEGIDKSAVGKFAAEVRDVRPPEPYKGKGIKYKGEYIRRKEGKKAAK